MFTHNISVWISVAHHIFVCVTAGRVHLPPTVRCCVNDRLIYVWYLNLRKEERAAVSVLCLGRREIRGAVIGCVERSHTDKSQQRKVLYRCLKTGSERWKIIWSFKFRVLCVPLKDHLFCWLPFQSVHVFGFLIMHANTSTNQLYFCLFFHFIHTVDMVWWGETRSGNIARLDSKLYRPYVTLDHKASHKGRFVLDLYFTYTSE